jgi:hypothetical protein
MKKLIRFLFAKKRDVPKLADMLVVGACSNCGTPLSGRYCYQCGQKKEEKNDFKISHFFGETFHAFTHFDTKFFISLKYLMLRPGLLTLEYIRGHRKKYMNPIQLFFICNIFYFLLAPGNTFTTPLGYFMEDRYLGGIEEHLVTQKLKETGKTYEMYESKFEEHEKLSAKTLVFIMVPIFAMILNLMFVGQKRYFVEHLVYALHFFSFMLLYLIIGVYIYAILANLAVLVAKLFYAKEVVHQFVGFLSTDAAVSSVLGIVFMIYFFISMKRVYGQSNTESAIKSIASPFLLFLTVTIYRCVLFFVSFYGLKVGLH